MINWILSKLDKYKIRVYRGYHHDSCDRSWAEEKHQNRYRIFCCGETGADSEAGVLFTMIPLEVGHIHKIKGRDWWCEWISENSAGEPLANFRLVKN